MSGHVSRRRGKRGEYLLRDHLRALGWTADRVPSSGASEGFKGDVVATRGDVKKVFEVKNHSGTFKKIYELYDAHCRALGDDLMTFVAPGEARLCVSVSSSLDAVLENAHVYELQERHPLSKKYSRQFQKLGNLQNLLGSADILVLKDDRKPFLFVRYR